MSEKVLLATYQPMVRAPWHRNPRYDCFMGRLGGERPVFCFPARTADEFLFRSMLAVPALPERLVLFESGAYARFDAVIWNNVKNLDRESREFAEGFERMFDGVDERYSEYVVPESAILGSIDEMPLVDAVELGCLMGSDDWTEGFLSVLREKARQLALSLDEGAGRGVTGPDEWKALARFNGFLMFLGACGYRAVMGQPMGLIDTIPLIPSPGLVAANEAWLRFGELHCKVYSEPLGGTHRDYDEMCRAFEEAIGGSRLNWLARSCDPDDECPCMSGRKLGGCHGKTPVDIFPFQRP